MTAPLETKRQLCCSAGDRRLFSRSANSSLNWEHHVPVRHAEGTQTFAWKVIGADNEACSTFDAPEWPLPVIAGAPFEGSRNGLIKQHEVQRERSDKEDCRQKSRLNT